MFGSHPSPFALYLLFALGLLTFWILLPYMTSLLIGLILGIICLPLHSRIKKWCGEWKRTAASLTLVAFILIVLVPLGFIISSLTIQANTVVQKIPEWINPQYLDIGYMEDQVFALTGQEVEIKETLMGLSSSVGKYTIEVFKNVAAKSTAFFVHLFIVLMLMYFIFVDGEAIMKKLREYIPFNKKNTERLIKEVDEIIKAISYGQGLASALQGVVGAIMFAALGISGAVFWGFMMAILAFFPVVGASLVWIPAALIMLFVGDYFSAITIAIVGGVIISQIENIVKPLMMQGYTEIHSFNLFMGIFAGLSAFGIIGLFIGPIILSTFFTVVELYHEEAS